jgi:hypothetical protein
MLSSQDLTNLGLDDDLSSCIEATYLRIAQSRFFCIFSSSKLSVLYLVLGQEGHQLVMVNLWLLIQKVLLPLFWILGFEILLE